MASLRIAQLIRPGLDNISKYIQVSPDVAPVSGELFYIFAFLWVIVFARFNIYHPQKEFHPRDGLFYHMVTSLVAFIAIGVFLFLASRDISRVLFLSFGLISMLFLYLRRFFYWLLDQRQITASTLVQNLLFPILLLALYSYSFALTSSRWLPEGVNYTFTSSLSSYSVYAILVVLLIILSRYQFKKDGTLLAKKPGKRFAASDLLLLLIPLTPVIIYIFSNQEILSLFDSLIIAVVILSFSFIWILAIPFLLSPFSPARILMAVGLSFAFTIINMASLSHSFSWFNEGRFEIQLGLMVIVFFATWYLSGLKNKRDLSLIIGVFLVGNVLIQSLGGSDRVDHLSTPTQDHPLLSTVHTKTPATLPNIYLLVYESYVTNGTMLGYGIDNSPQEEYLREQGFILYPHTYSIGPDTLSSISRVLNASTHFYGPPRRAASGDGVVQNVLGYLGYRTYGIFPYDFMFLGIGSSYNFSFPEKLSVPPYSLLISAIFIGEFRFDLGFDHHSYEEFVGIKHDIFKQTGGHQAFIYTHSPLPGHSQNSGVCLPDEIESYQQRLVKANREMQQDIELLLENDPDAVIIVAGDHGPYLTKNCTITTGVYDISEISRLDIQDRFGAFLAIRWPTDEVHKYDDITVLQDIFIAIFAYLYDDPSLLNFTITPYTFGPGYISGASVQDGIIVGGINHGEPLFLSD